MNFQTLTFFLAQGETPAGGAPAPAGPGAWGLIMWVLLLVLLWVVMIRPQKKRQQEHQATLDSIQEGDQVITAGGIHGLVMKIKDNNTISLKIAENVKIDVEKASVSTVKKKSGSDE